MRAQLVVKGVILKNREVIDPREFLKHQVHVDPDLVDSLDGAATDAGMDDMISSFEALDEAKRLIAASDDKKTRGH